MAKKSQKNNVAYVKPAFENPTALAEALNALYIAKSRYIGAQELAAEQIVKCLEENRGEEVLCKDIAEAMDVRPQIIGQLVCRASTCYKVQQSDVTITYTFAEVDENGQLIKNGKRRKVKQKMKAYTIK